MKKNKYSEQMFRPVRVLERNIKSGYYKRMLSTQLPDKENKALEFVKDPFVLEFMGVTTNISQLESDLETAIINNAFNSLEDKQAGCRDKLSEIKAQYENAKKEVQKPFSREEELRGKSERLEELNALLSLDEKDSSLLGMDNEPSKPVTEEREATGLER